MAQMGFCDKHNMVAFLQKPSGSEEFHQIVDFLADSHIRKVQTLFKKDSEVSKSEKKRDAKEALLQESFRKLRTSQASVHHVSSTRGHCIYMLPEKDYPLTTEVMLVMSVEDISGRG
ncbi:hypothetical protein Tco_0143738 [Tanacetum coccineum]